MTKDRFTSKNNEMRIPEIERLRLLDEFRMRMKRLSIRLEDYDIHGISTKEEQEAFWEALATEGEDLVAVFRSIVKQQGGSARQRILKYLKDHVGEVVDGATLESVAGISEWARRVRELHVEMGYRITTSESDESLRPGQYRLETVDPDNEKAEWWRFKQSLRRDSLKTVHQKILDLLAKKVGHPVDEADIEYVSNQKNWHQCLQELRYEHGGWRVSSSLNRPDILTDQFLLEDDRELLDRYRINARLFEEVLKRDNFTCRQCGWGKSHPKDNRRWFLDVAPILSTEQKTVQKTEDAETLCNHCYSLRFASIENK